MNLVGDDASENYLRTHRCFVDFPDFSNFPDFRIFLDWFRFSAFFLKVNICTDETGYQQTPIKLGFRCENIRFYYGKLQVKFFGRVECA